MNPSPAANSPHAVGSPASNPSQPARPANATPTIVVPGSVASPNASGAPYVSPSSSVGAPPSIQVPGHSASSPTVTTPQHNDKTKDAFGYLEKVKTQFAQQPAIYNQFLDVMKEFKSHNIRTEGVIVRIKELF